MSYRKTPTLAEIRARARASTQGEFWHWSGVRTSNSIHLLSYAPRAPVVMAFQRWGTQSAQPIFRDAKRDLLIKPNWVTSQDHNAWKITGIDHPDAIAIAHYRSDMDTLLALFDQQQTLLVEERARAQWASALLKDESNDGYFWEDPDLAEVREDCRKEARQWAKNALEPAEEEG